MEAEKEGFLQQLDGPRIGIAALIAFMLVMTIFGIKLYSDQRKQVDLLDAIVREHAAQTSAANRKTVEQCFSDATQAPLLRRVIKALEGETSSPKARLDLEEFRRLNDLNAPTLRECRQLADRIGITVKQEVGG